MPDFHRDIPVTRSAFLELKEEQALVRDGYNLLDQKRILLAHEVRRVLARLRQLREESDRCEEAAIRALREALQVHGGDELSVYPPLAPDTGQLTVKRRRLLGLELVETQLQEGETPGPQPAPHSSREAHACALAFRAWQLVLVDTAAASTNLRRLVREYLRTHRRAEALENVLLPEIQATLQLMDDRLESQDQEETARMRLHRER